jgi:MFS family permease
MIRAGIPSGDRALRWIDGRFFGNTLAEKLQRRRARRRVAAAGCLFSIAFGFMLGYAAWSFIAPNPVSTLEKLLSALFWLAIFSCFLIPALVQMAVGSVVAKPNQPYDERQRQLFIESRSKALAVAQVLLLVAFATGLGTLILMIAGHLPWSHPVYGGLPFYTGFCGMLFVLVSLSPFLFLALELPDEPDLESGP